MGHRHSARFFVPSAQSLQVKCRIEPYDAEVYNEMSAGDGKRYNGPYVKTMHEEIIVNSEEVT